VRFLCFDSQLPFVDLIGPNQQIRDDHASSMAPTAARERHVRLFEPDGVGFGFRIQCSFFANPLKYRDRSTSDQLPSLRRPFLANPISPHLSAVQKCTCQMKICRKLDDESLPMCIRNVALVSHVAGVAHCACKRSYFRGDSFSTVLNLLKSQ
jgi:hypothetical protein